MSVRRFSRSSPVSDTAFRRAFERSADAHLFVDRERRVVGLNPAAEELLSGHAGELVGARVEDVLVAPHDPDWRTTWDRLRTRRTGRARLADDGSRRGGVELALIADVEEDLDLLVVRDPGAGARDEMDRAATLRAVVDSSHDAVMSLGADGNVTAASARAELVLGYSERALVGRPLSDVVVEESRDEVDALVRVALGGRDVFQHDTQIRRRDRRIIDVTIDLAPLRPVRDSSVMGVSVIVQDITARKRLERQLRHQAERDPLTGLYNRRRFEGELYRALRLAQRHQEVGAVLLMDVDRFKVVNDTHGHASGDELLKHLASDVRSVLRETDLPARLGGDEFAVLLPNVADGAAAATAERVLEAARPRLRRWDVSTSVGVACFGADSGLDARPVVANADAALYRAKALGGDRVVTDPAAEGSQSS